MRSDELASTETGVQAAEPSEPFAFMVHDSQPRSEVWDIAVYVHCRTELADVADRT